LTRVIPHLSVDGNKVAWAKFEAAKRRLNYSLLGLGLPVRSKVEEPENGLFYEFLADSPGSPVMTGHDFGVITINLAEADDAERERRRVQLNEPYRTILGHFRHEVGHYYWDRFFADEENAAALRSVFGDEREDYAEALKRHYETGAPVLWQENFISSYATTILGRIGRKPGRTIFTWPTHWKRRPRLACLWRLAGRTNPLWNCPVTRPESFDTMVESWFSLTYMLNNLNRGLGFPDGYPFILSDAVVKKLRFVHEIIGKRTSSQR